jgi:hypothetical protein
VDHQEHRCAYRVVTHDSWRGDGRPVAVFSGEARFDIVEIERSWIAAGIDTASPVRRGFEVRCKGGARFTLVHIDDQGWCVDLHPGPRLVTSDEGGK